jgi:hypothetical protein
MVGYTTFLQVLDGRIGSRRIEHGLAQTQLVVGHVLGRKPDCHHVQLHSDAEQVSSFDDREGRDDDVPVRGAYDQVLGFESTKCFP